MMKFLLIDFGASRIKSAVADLKTGSITGVASQSSVLPVKAAPGIYEVPVHDLAGRFMSICSAYSGKAGYKLDGIVICSEMHGFTLLDNGGNPKTGYISWKDSRALVQLKGISTFDLVSRDLGEKFRAITGMTLRPGLPYLNAMHLARMGILKDGDQLASLPELVVSLSGKGRTLSHETMSAGLGFYDIYRRGQSAELMDYFVSRTCHSPQLGETSEKGICGYVRCAGRELPVFVGLGDHQCALLGAGNDQRTVSVNIGTGSQVSVLSMRRKPKLNQQRPFFDGYLLDTITHIPGGRALNEYVLFLLNVAEHFGARRADVWRALRKVTAEDVRRSSLGFGLCVFPGAWGGEKTGSISGIIEGSLTTENYLASLLRAVADQYVQAVNLIKPVSQDRLLLSGGIPQKLGVLRELLARGIGMPAFISAEREETFAGLRAAAAVFSGEESDFLSAAGKFKTKVRRK